MQVLHLCSKHCLLTFYPWTSPTWPKFGIFKKLRQLHQTALIRRVTEIMRFMHLIFLPWFLTKLIALKIFVIWFYHILPGWDITPLVRAVLQGNPIKVSNTSYLPWTSGGCSWDCTGPATHSISLCRHMNGPQKSSGFHKQTRNFWRPFWGPWNQ